VLFDPFIDPDRSSRTNLAKEGKIRPVASLGTRPAGDHEASTVSPLLRHALESVAPFK
jgi:hypothetical protein